MINAELLNGSGVATIFHDAGWELFDEDKDSLLYIKGNTDVTIYDDSIVVHQETMSCSMDWVLITSEIMSINVNDKQLSVTLYCGDIFLFKLHDGGDKQCVSSV